MRPPKPIKHEQAQRNKGKNTGRTSSGRADIRAKGASRPLVAPNGHASRRPNINKGIAGSGNILQIMKERLGPAETISVALLIDKGGNVHVTRPGVRASVDRARMGLKTSEAKKVANAWVGPANGREGRQLFVRFVDKEHQKEHGGVVLTRLGETISRFRGARVVESGSFLPGHITKTQKNRKERISGQ
jgi:hypothetical protein